MSKKTGAVPKNGTAPVLLWDIGQFFRIYALAGDTEHFDKSGLRELSFCIVYAMAANHCIMKKRAAGII